MERDSREKFSADLRRQEIISPDWRRARSTALISAGSAIVGLGLGKADPSSAFAETLLYVTAALFGLATVALLQWKRFFIKKPPLE